MYTLDFRAFNGSGGSGISKNDNTGSGSVEIAIDPTIQPPVAAWGAPSRWRPPPGLPSRESLIVLDAVMDTMKAEKESISEMDGDEVDTYTNVYGYSVIEQIESHLPMGHAVPDLYSLRKRVRSRVRQFLKDYPEFLDIPFCWVAKVEKTEDPVVSGRTFHIWIGYSLLPR